jgi:hypothetical protein
MEKVLILGLSKSGIAAAELAKSVGYDVYITEYNKPKEEYIEEITRLRALGIQIETGGHTDAFIEDASFAVTSPGIPPKSEIFTRLYKNNIPIMDVAPIETNELNNNKNKLEINLKPNIIEESKNDINNMPENNTNNNRIVMPKDEHSDKNVSEIKLKSPQVTIDKNKEKNENNKNNIEANKGKKDINLKETDKNKKEFLLEGMITGIKSPRNRIINFNISDEMLKENKKRAKRLRNSSSEVKGPRIIKKKYNAYNSSINNKLNSKNNLIKNPNFKFEGSIPGAKIDYIKGKTNSNFHNN